MIRAKLLLLAILSVVLAACEANLESQCVGGPCGPDAQPADIPDPVPCDPENVPAVGDYPNDVGAVIKSKCQKCHTDPPANGAPFPLLTFEDTQELYPPTGSTSTKVAVHMISAIETDFMPFGDVEPDLTAAEKKLVLHWLKSECAMPVDEGTGADVGE